MKYAGLNPKAFGLAGGILWGAGVLVLALWAGQNPEAWGGALTELVTWLGQFYKGLEPSTQGAVAGGLWGFVDAGVGCWVFAWLYNKLNK